MFNIMLANMMDSPVASETVNNPMIAGNDPTNALIAYTGLLGMGGNLTQTTGGQSTGAPSVSGNISTDNQKTTKKQDMPTNLILLDISSLLQLNTQPNLVQSNAPAGLLQSNAQAGLLQSNAQAGLLQLNAQANLLQLKAQPNLLQPNTQTTPAEGDTQAATTTNDTTNILQQQIAALISKSGQAKKEPSVTPEPSTSANVTPTGQAQSPVSKDAIDNALNKLLSNTNTTTTVKQQTTMQSENTFNSLLLNNSAQNSDGINMLNSMVVAAVKTDNEGDLGHLKEGQGGVSHIETDSSNTNPLANAHSTAVATPKASFHSVSGNDSEARPQKLLQINDTTFSVMRKSDNSIQVRVEPDGIGKLDIGLSVDKGVVSAQISATDPAGKELLEKNLHHILDALAKEGISVGGFSVSLKDRRDGLYKDDSNGQNANSAEGAAVEVKGSGELTPVTNYKNNGKINIFA
ncbi:MAG: flagellar hook-length control protein FliK [Nitrospirae bacterium]|nr:flagellar hook-length control protein FliK [Nitrospirota bacterium]